MDDPSLYNVLGRALHGASWSAALSSAPLYVARGLGWCGHETIEALVGFRSPILLRPGFFLRTLDYEPVNLYIRNIIPDDISIPLLGYRALSGWGYADFHASVNFAFTEFYEVRLTSF